MQISATSAGASFIPNPAHRTAQLLHPAEAGLAAVQKNITPCRPHRWLMSAYHASRTMNDDILHSRLPDESDATRFWWIRHAPVPEIGELMYGSLDLDCDTSDEATIKAVAARLPVGAVWVTSHLKRTRQTADALLAAGARADCIIEDRAIGEMDFGDMNGRPHRELLAEREDPFVGFFPISPHATAPAGESFEALTTRVADFVERMHQRYVGRDLICIAHRGSILAALRQALMLPLQTSPAFVIDNISVTQLVRYRNRPPDGPQFRVWQVGWLPHHGAGARR